MCKKNELVTRNIQQIIIQFHKFDTFLLMFLFSTYRENLYFLKPDTQTPEP